MAVAVVEGVGRKVAVAGDGDEVVARGSVAATGRSCLSVSGRQGIAHGEGGREMPLDFYSFSSVEAFACSYSPIHLGFHRFLCWSRFSTSK